MKVKTNVKAGDQTNNQVAGLINANVLSAFVNSSVG
jgi:hypothetical protein